MSVATQPAMQRALELSRRLLEAARQGDLATVVDLDAERAPLLKGYLSGTPRIGPAEAELLQAIGQLNEESLDSLEQRRRDTAASLDRAKQGRRAINAYATVQVYRR